MSFVPSTNCKSCARPNLSHDSAANLVIVVGGTAFVAGLATGFIARRVVRGGKTL